MANRNEDQDAAGPSGEKPKKPAAREGEGAAPRAPEGFLPDDSFLLDVDDEAGRSPAPMADPAASVAGSEEWIVVDDDLSISEPAPAAPAAPQAAAAPAPEEPVEASSHEAVAEPATTEEPEPVAAAQTAVPKWYAGDESDLPSFVANDAEATGAAALAAPIADVAATSQPAALEPVAEPAAAPILSLANARARKLKLAAAALVVALGATAAYLYQTRVGAGSEGSTEVASAPRKPRVAPIAPAPTPTPVEPVVETPPVEVAPTPEPVVAPPVAVAPPTPAVAPPAEVAHPDPVPAPIAATAPVAIDPVRKRPLPDLTRDPKAGAPGPKSDTIVELKNGHTFRGQITRVKGSRVTLRVGTGECVFDLSEVSLLDSSAPEYRRIDQMPEASVVLASGQHLRGRLMKQTDEHVVLVVNNGQLVFSRADIRDVTFTGRIHF